MFYIIAIILGIVLIIVFVLIAGPNRILAAITQAISGFAGTIFGGLNSTI